MSRVPTLDELNAPDDSDSLQMPTLAELNTSDDVAEPVMPSLAELNALTPEEISGRIADHATQYTVSSRKGVLQGAADRQTKLTFPQMFRTFVPLSEQKRLSLIRADALAKNDPTAITAANTAIYNVTRSAVDQVDPQALPESAVAMRSAQPYTQIQPQAQPAITSAIQTPRVGIGMPLPAAATKIEDESGNAYAVDPATRQIKPIVENNTLGGMWSALGRGYGSAIRGAGQAAASIADTVTNLPMTVARPFMSPQDQKYIDDLKKASVGETQNDSVYAKITHLGEKIVRDNPQSTAIEEGGFKPGNWRWWTENAPESVPMLIGQLGLLYATAGGSALTQFAAFAGPSAVTTWGNSYKDAIDRGAPQEVAMGEGLLNGAISAAMQKINIAPLMNNSATKQFFQNAVLNKAAQIGTKATAEGISNALVSAAQSAAEDTVRYVSESDPRAYENWKERYLASGTQGFGAGVVMGGVAAAADQVPQKKEFNAAADRKMLDSQAGHEIEPRPVLSDKQTLGGQPDIPAPEVKTAEKVPDDAARMLESVRTGVTDSQPERSATPPAESGRIGSQHESKQANDMLINPPTVKENLTVDQPLSRDMSPEKKSLVIKGLKRFGGMDDAQAEAQFQSLHGPVIRALARAEGVSPDDMVDRIGSRRGTAAEAKSLSTQEGSQVLGSTVAVRMGDVMRIGIKAMQGSDPATAVHEYLHAYRLLAGEIAKRSPKMREIVSGFERDLGVKSGVWEKGHEEAFVDRFMNYLKTDQAPTPRIRRFFDAVKDMLVSIVRNAGTPKETGVGMTDASPEFRKWAQEWLKMGESDAGANAVSLKERAPRPVAEKVLFEENFKHQPDTSLPMASDNPTTLSSHRSDFQQTHIAFDPPESHWNLSGLMHKAYSQFVDQAHPLISLIADTDPRKKADAINQIARIRGHQGITEELLTGKGFRDITSVDHPEKIISGSKSLEQILSPLHQNRELYEDYEAYRIAQRHVALGLNRQDVLSDPVSAEAELGRLRAKYTPDQMKTFEAVSAEHRQYDRHLLDALHKAGRLSDETYNKIVHAPEADSYASFAREIEQLPDDAIKAGTGSVGPKHIQGSELRVQPTVESTIAATERVVRFVEQQKVNTLLTQLRNHPGMDQYIQEAKAPGAATISTWENGKEQHWTVPREIKNALGYTTPQEMNLAIKLLSIPAKVLRAGATLSVDFIARNPVRDQFSALINAEHGFVPVYDTVRGLFDFMGKSDLYHEWKASGGAQAFFTSLDREATHVTAQSLLGQGPKWYVRWARNPLDALRALSEFTEVGTRLGVYRRARETGVNAVEAARNSREATIDFQRAGSVGRSVNQITAFWNANVQGVDILARRLSDPKTRNITLLRIGLGITAPTLGVWLWNNRDEESRQRYLNIPRTTRNLFWTIDMGADRPALRIPKPFEAGIIFGSLPERVLDWSYAKDPHALDHFAETSGGALVPGIIPTAALPALEHITNYSFFRGRPLENDSLQKLPAGMRSTPYISELANRVGKLTDISLTFPTKSGRAGSD